MALGDPYMTVAEFRARLGSVDSTADDAVLTMLTSASEQIDGYCGQQFNRSASATAEYISPTWDYGILDVPNLVSVTEIATDTGARTYPTIWAPTDYDLYPFDAATRSRPYTQIRTSPLGVYAWPNLARGVRVTGIWGWPAVPAPVKEACFLLANRGKSLWNAPFGKTGDGEYGAGMNMTDAVMKTVWSMLDQFRVVTV